MSLFPAEGKLNLRRRFVPRGDLTTIFLDGPVVSIDLRIRTKMCPRERRAIALAFFRHLRPWLGYFTHSYFRSSGDLNFRRAESGLNLFHARGILTPAGQIDEVGELGFKIRMLRLERGWRQADLAKAAGLSASHMSQIERGVVQPHRSTLIALGNALGADLSSVKLPSRPVRPDRLRKFYFRYGAQ